MRNKSTALHQNLDYQRENLTEPSETSFENWCKLESYKLAPTVYEDLQSGTKINGKFLPAGYTDTAKAIAQK